VGGFTEGLSGALVNSSRGILFPSDSPPGTHWKDACRRAAQAMVVELRAVLAS